MISEEGIQSVGEIAFDDTKENYSGTDDLFDLTFSDTEDAKAGKEALDDVKKVLEDCDLYISTQVGAEESSAEALAKDMNLILVLAVVIIVAILLLSTKAYLEIPVLLVLTIQGSIWINFSVPVLTGGSVFFIAYLIVSAIQMSATIDYAIVISNRYLQLKQEMPIKKAMTETLNQSFPTIFTSGSILTCAGFLIGEIASDATVASIGVALGRGTLISIILVLFVLPQILLLGDIIIEKTALTINLARTQRDISGRVRISGHVRGYVQGEIDADVKGAFQGQMHVDGVLPEIPEKERYYAVWQEELKKAPVTENLTVEAEYFKWKESAASDETKEKHAVLLMEGAFLQTV